MEKKKYEKPEIKVVYLNTDIVVMSGGCPGYVCPSDGCPSDVCHTN